MSALGYVTLDEAKAHLRIPYSDSFDDEHLYLMIDAASAAVKNYLNDFSTYQGERNSDDDQVVDSNYEPVKEYPEVVRPEVKVACLLLIGEWWNNREGDGGSSTNLPAAVQSILYPLRDPVCR